MVASRKTIHCFIRGRSGSAMIELGLAIFVMIVVFMVVFDVYAMVKSRSASGRLAVILSDFVARETGSDYGDQLDALGQYLYEQELGSSVDVVYVISVVEKPTGDDAAVVWTDDTMRFGDSTRTASLADECAQLGTAGWKTMLVGTDATVPLADGDAVVVAEVCAQLLGAGFLTSSLFTGNAYRVHVTPFRTPSQIPPSP